MSTTFGRIAHSNLAAMVSPHNSKIANALGLKSRIASPGSRAH
jgi:hypothetical protein